LIFVGFMPKYYLRTKKSIIVSISLENENKSGIVKSSKTGTYLPMPGFRRQKSK